MRSWCWLYIAAGLLQIPQRTCCRLLLRVRATPHERNELQRLDRARLHDRQLVIGVGGQVPQRTSRMLANWLARPRDDDGAAHARPDWRALPLACATVHAIR